MGPAPPTRRPGSAFGPQRSARFRSAPSYGWGTAPIGSAAPKVFISKDHVSDTLGNHSPGPMYHPPPPPQAAPAYSFGISDRSGHMPVKLGAGHLVMPSGFCEQLESHKKTAPMPSFGMAGRSSGQPVKVASPGEYMPPASGAANMDSRRASPSAFGFPRSQRFYDHRGNAVPGPGTYSRGLPIAHGPQVLSDKPSRPQSAFARASREHGSATACMAKGSASPGPGAHTPRKDRAFGEQIRSARRSQSGFGFGGAPRFQKETNEDVPGPGRYYPC